MSNSITFILPTLFDAHSQKFLDSQALSSMQQLTAQLAKSNKQSIGNLQQWLSNQYRLPADYANSAYLMAQAQGLTTADDDINCHWLRADPVMLTVTHNGIYCRGNRVLNITLKERNSLESIVNDYFKERSIELILCTSNQGYLKYIGNAGCQFMPLADVMGQDISQRLPSGDNATFWHQMLTDLQMLLHNCDVNQQRMNEGQPTISGFWLWAEAEYSNETARQPLQQSKIYSDDPALSGALDLPITVQQLESLFESSKFNNRAITIDVSEFNEAHSQSDAEGWLVLYKRWVFNWLLPALEAVNNSQLQHVSLLAGDGYCYQYNEFSRYCFWRNHRFNAS